MKGVTALTGSPPGDRGPNRRSGPPDDRGGSVDRVTEEPQTPPEDRRGVVVVDGGGDTRLHWSRRGETTEVELAGGGLDHAEAAQVTAVVRAVGSIRSLPATTGSRLVLAADHPADHDRPLPGEVAAALGLAPRRELLQLRRSLPLPEEVAERGRTDLPLRAFRPGADDAAWLRANNRAFASHPDQGAETSATLATRSSEPWFDRTGFLVLDDLERPGELAGFCWTKVHAPTDDEPAIGEIYVIGVDPSRQGEGLGVALVVAGLDHLAERGVTTANLYVEADNRPARRLYAALGFTVHERRRVYGP